MPIGDGIAKRQLHFIFVCDCSGSMLEDGKIQALNQAIRETIPEMQKVAGENPNAQVMMRALSFSDDAMWHVAQPTPLEQFRWDKDLQADGLTYLNRALDRLTDAFNDPHLPTRMLRPVVVLISDGQPSDPWEKNLDALIATTWGGKAIRLAVAIGRDADRDVLQRFIGNREIKVFEANSPKALVERIKWASTQALAASGKSKPVDHEGGEGAGAAVPIMPAPPPTVDTEDEWLD
jgi:uncharacterized protein YegL